MRNFFPILQSKCQISEAKISRFFSKIERGKILKRRFCHFGAQNRVICQNSRYNFFGFLAKIFCAKILKRRYCHFCALNDVICQISETKFPRFLFMNSSMTILKCIYSQFRTKIVVKMSNLLPKIFGNVGFGKNRPLLQSYVIATQ